MNETITIAFNAVIAKLIDPSSEVKDEVQRILSYKVEGAEQSDAFKLHRWDGRSSFLVYKPGLFPVGFVDFVTAKLRTKGYSVKHVKKPLPAPLGPEEPKVDEFPHDPRYDYQAETIRRLEKYGRMIARIATGGGKSRIAKLAYARLQRPTLFLTTRSVLMYQMADSFKQLGAKPGLLGDGHWDPRPNGVNCAMVQTLIAKLEDPKMEWDIERKLEWERQRGQVKDLLGTFELVIGEEAHEVSGAGYYALMNHCTRAHYRLALTATPFMKDDEEANMMLMASFGSIGIKVSEKQLIDCGILARPIFKFVDMPAAMKPPKLYRSTSWQPAYRIGIVDNELRNRAIAFEAKRAVEHGLSVIALVREVRHGEILERLVGELGVKVDYIHGKHEQVERAAALTKLRKGVLSVLVGSTILDVGVDVPAVGMVILAGGGKAEVALRQRIGRGLREKKKGPNISLIVDFADDHNTYLRDHYRERRSIIENTPGFAENILPSRVDFDFAALGFAKLAAAA
jgi:superfamily II DNA or RNA helicase